MKTARLLFLPLLAVLLLACGQTTTYYLVTEDARGLAVGADVYRQGVRVGEVEAIDFAGGRVRIEVATEEPLYAEQRFRIRRGSTGVAVHLARPGENQPMLSTGTTLTEPTLSSDPFGLVERLTTTLSDALEGRADELEDRLNDWEARGETLEDAAGGWVARLERRLEAWEMRGEAAAAEWEAAAEAWAEQLEYDLEEAAEIIERASERHPPGSPAWKREVKRALGR